MSSVVPRIGDVIADKYRIERRLGGGGMGTVFAATHLMTGRRFAIKWMNTRSGHDTAARERFIREFQAAGSIDHPNVVATLDVGSHDGTLFIVMEYLEGESLGRRISRGPMVASACVPIVVEAMRGVAAAHRLDIVHRDLKPDNIFVCNDERAGLMVKVLDFGVMKPVNARASTLPTITARGMAVGTPPYMAPEQVLALPSLDHRVDIYSFGVILYEALTGRLPYADVTGLLLLERIVRGGPPALSQFAAGVPIGLEATVMRALSRDPRRRFQKLADFAACLQPWAAGAGAFGTVGPAVRRQMSSPEADGPRVLSLAPYAVPPALVSEARAVARESSTPRPSTPQATHAPQATYATTEAPSDASHGRASTPDAWAALAKGRESYPAGRETPDRGVAIPTVIAEPPTPVVAVDPPVATSSGAAERAEDKHSSDRHSSPRSGRERKRRRRGRKKKEKAPVAVATDASVPVDIVAIESAQSASASATDGEPQAQDSSIPAAEGEAAGTSTPSEQPVTEMHAADGAPPTAAEARERKDSGEARVELPIEAALRRALAREGRLPLRHGRNTPDVDADVERASEGGIDDAFAELRRDAELRRAAEASSGSRSSDASSYAARGDHRGSRNEVNPEDAAARRSRVPTLPLRLQDIEALRAALSAERTDSRRASETAITAEMSAPRSSRISMYDVSPWPEDGPADTWSAPTEMAVPSPRNPAMRNRAGWGLVTVATLVVCGIAWTQWDVEEDYLDSEQSVSAASDIFASNPDDPFAELAPSLADPPLKAAEPTAAQMQPARSQDLAGQSPSHDSPDARDVHPRASETPSTENAYPTPNEPPARGPDDSSRATESAHAAPPGPAPDRLAEPAAAPAQGPSYDLARGTAPSNYEYPSSIDVPTAAPESSGSGLAAFSVAKAAASDARVPAAPPVQARPSSGNAVRSDAPARSSATAVRAVNGNAPNTAAPDSNARAAASAPNDNAEQQEKPAATPATPPTAGKVTVVPAIVAMGPPEATGARGTSATTTPATAGAAILPTSESAAPGAVASAAPSTATGSAAAPAPSPLEVAPSTQPVDGHAALVQHDVVLLAPARAPEGAVEPSHPAVAPLAATPRPAPIEYSFAGPSPLATSTPAGPTNAQAETHAAVAPRQPEQAPASQVAKSDGEIAPAPTPDQPKPSAQSKPSAQPKPDVQPKLEAQVKPAAQPKLAAQPKPVAQPKPAAQPKLTAQPKPVAQPKLAAQPKLTAQPKPVAQPKLAAQPKPVAQPKPAAQPKPVAQPEPVVQPKPRAASNAAIGTGAKPAKATVTVTKLDVASPNANAAPVDVPTPAARSGDAKSPRPRKTSGVSVDDF